MKKSKKKGFTLVEALVTVTILGIVAAFLVPSFSSVSNDQKSKSDVTRIEHLSDQIGLVCSYQDAFDELTKLVDGSNQVTLKFPINKENGKGTLDFTQVTLGDTNTKVSTLAPKTYAYFADLSQESIKFDAEEHRSGSVIVTIQFNATNSTFAQEQGREPEIAKDLTEVSAVFAEE